MATLSLRDARVSAFSDVRSAVPVNARFSPDGRWVAYTHADRGTETTISVEPFPATGAKHQIVVQKPLGTPHKPVWSPDGRELFYVPSLGKFEVVQITTRPNFAFGPTAPIPRMFAPGAPAVRALFDITPEGRLIGVIPAGDTSRTFSAPPIHVVLNWPEELKRLVPVN